MAKYRVDGYLFETEKEARQAKKEADSIRYIRAQTRMNDPDVMYKLYDKLIEKKTFETVVGIEFLRELQTYLESVPSIRDEDIAPIPVPDSEADREREARHVRAAEREKARTGREGHYRRLFQFTGTLSVVLALIVVGMFVITYLSGNSMNIFNYEQQVIDKYEAWEQELDQREEDISRREEILQNQMEE
jgi:hypothetical protein